MKNDNIHAEMRDELAASAIFDGFESLNIENDEQQKILSQESKYHRAEGFHNWAQIDGEMAMTLVLRPSTGGVALVVRKHLGQFVKVNLDDCLGLDSHGIIRAATPEMEPLAGWHDWSAMDTATRLRMKETNRRPWTKLEIPMIKILFRVENGMDAATIEAQQQMALAQGEQIISQTRNAREYKVARDIEGFGDPAPTRKEPVDLGF